MNTLKRTLALVATLAMASTAFAACGSKDSSDTPTTTAPAQTDAPTEGTTADTEPVAGGNSMELGEVKLPTNGSSFNVVSWDAQDCPKLIELWAEKNGKSTTDANFVDLGTNGSGASAALDQRFSSDENTDVFFVEADGALNYINNDEATVALDQLGFSEDNWRDAFPYTVEIGKATSGKNSGKIVGASWQAAAGGFAYRTDLADKYLDVKTPEAMQEKIGDWDKFKAAALEVAQKTDKKVNLADSLGGMWQVFSAGRQNAFVNSSNRIVFDDKCEEFAKLAKELWDNGGVSHINQWDDAWIQAGLGDDDNCTMGYFVSTWGFTETNFFGKASANSRGKWNVVQGPGNYFWGGTWIVVHPGCDNADLAQSFIKTATVDQAAMKQYATTKPEFVNNKTAMSEVIAENLKIEFATENLGGQNYFKSLDENVKSININGLITPYDAKIKDEFMTAIREDYIKGGKSYQDAIDAAISKVQADVPALAGNA